MTNQTSQIGDIHSPDFEENVRREVRAGYAEIAKGDRDGCGCDPSCCTTTASSVATSVGYDIEELATLPEGADMGLSCGNPTAIASLTEGETVLDLGSGGGLDIFLAGPKVGATGCAIGVDMTADMVSKARRGVAHYTETTGLDNVDFRLGEIEHLPVRDASVDVVISNCVVNLSPNKSQVWREVERVLKPGGRVAISDLVLLRPLPDAVSKRIASWVGCVAGASHIEDVRAMVEAAGLVDIEITPRTNYVKTMDSLQDPLYQAIVDGQPDDFNLSDYVTSADITAHKAPEPCC